MSWGVLGSLIVLGMVVIAIVGKRNGDGKLLAFGVTMALAFGTSVVVQHALLA